jgi:hypothetical protein
MLVVWFVDAVLRSAVRFDEVERPQRSMTASGELLRGQIPQRGVWPLVVVFFAVIAAKYFCLQFAPVRMAQMGSDWCRSIGPKRASQTTKGCNPCSQTKLAVQNSNF